jgi:hypothetical protein
MQRFGIAFLAGTLLVGATALTHAQDQKAGLEQEVQALRQEVDTLRRDLDETHALLEESLVYLDRQSQAAASMSQVLNASEEAGFTFGINPRSRELLLEGWRAALAEQQKGLPGAPPAEPENPDQRVLRGG